jgi:5-formyltetrahydrofolate cyclo-ligase
MQNSEFPREKAALRRWARSMTFDPIDLASASKLVVDRILRLPEYLEARHVLLYLAMPHEVNVEDLMRHESRPTKAWYAPRCAPDRRLAIHEYDPLTTVMRSGPHGIREPDRDQVPEIEPAAIDLILVPGLLFTPLGDRLGYGGGYYDRFLPQLPDRCKRLGIASDSQIVQDLPHDSWDAAVDFVVTPTSVLRH